MTTAHALNAEGIQYPVTLPDVTNGVNSRPFKVPRGAKSLTIYIPDLVGAGTTLALQALTPNIDGSTEVWTTISIFNVVDGTFNLIDGLVELTAVTIPCTATGGYILRFVASAAQAGAADAITVKTFFHMDR